jgi:hypothetical protein
MAQSPSTSRSSTRSAVLLATRPERRSGKVFSVRKFFGRGARVLCATSGLRLDHQSFDSVPSMWSRPDVLGLFSINVVSFSRNVVLSGPLFSINVVWK